MSKISVRFLCLALSLTVSTAVISSPKVSKKVVLNRSPIPITTETGTGKEKNSLDLVFENITSDLTLTNNYMWRGMTQTENLPAVQGGFTYDFPAGLYINVWGSNNKFVDTNITLEVDPGIGFYKEISDNVNYDISLYRYTFPGAQEFDYNELLGLVNFKFLQFSFGYSTNVFNVSDSGLYYNGGINYPIPSQALFGLEGIVFTALMGRYDLPEAAGLSYNDYLIGLSKAYKHYNFAVQWTTTNQREFYTYYGGSHLTGVVSVEF